MDSDILKVKLEAHLKWRRSEPGGERTDLSGAILSDAILSGADLRGAILRDAILSGANGMESWYAAIKTDLFTVLATSRTEVPALDAGRVDGSTYEGECACLVGTLAHARGLEIDDVPTRASAPAGTFARDADSPVEVWFGGIREGDTPSTSPTAAITAVWIREFLTANPMPQAEASALEVS